MSRMRQLVRKWFGPKTLRDKFSDLADRAARSRPAQNPGERLVHRIWWLAAETSNGGLSQYVTNSTGDSFDETVESLVTVGADETRDILLQLAHAAFPSGVVPKDRSERCALFREWEEREGSDAVVSDLTDRFRGSYEDLMRSVVAYGEAHPEYFPWLVT